MKKHLLALTLLTVLSVWLIAPVSAQEATETPEPAFPVTVEHKFGSTTIEQLPERVVSIGFTDQDPILALGVKPIAIRYWYGNEKDAVFPWAKEAAGDYVPQVLNMPYGNLNYEAILALKPDVIIALSSGITEEEYKALSQIAPTVAQSDEFIDFGMPWQETTQVIGDVLGKSAEAKDLIEKTEAQLEDVREANPEFEGKTVAVAYRRGENYGYYTDQDSRGRFFADLGFKVPDELVELAGTSFYADISTERVDLLDQDLLVFLGLQFLEGGKQVIESDPLIKSLKAVQEGRVLYIPPEYDDAFQFGTVLSLPYLWEGLVPEIKATLTGSSAEATPAS